MVLPEEVPHAVDRRQEPWGGDVQIDLHAEEIQRCATDGRTTDPSLGRCTSRTAR
jgi:hypothetical protein